MDPLGPFAAFLDRHPVAGWFLAGTSTVLGALPTWLVDARDAMGVLSVALGAVIGYFTVRIQADQWRERRERRRREAEEQARHGRLDERPPWS